MEGGVYSPRWVAQNCRMVGCLGKVRRGGRRRVRVRSVRTGGLRGVCRREKGGRWWLACVDSHDRRGAMAVLDTSRIHFFVVTSFGFVGTNRATGPLMRRSNSRKMPSKQLPEQTDDSQA